MSSLAGWYRVIFLSLAVAAGSVAAPSRAEDAAGVVAIEAPWQGVISSQIEAFRHKDAPAALSFAGTGFQVAFPSAETFFQAIVAAGYSPIVESRSHSFGAYRVVGEHVVVQQVEFVGNDQSLHGALYQMTEEPAGWRVQGVQLVKQPGLGV